VFQASAPITTTLCATPVFSYFGIWDEVSLSLRGLAPVLAARIIGVTDGAVAIAVIDAVLAPDRTLADMDAFLVG
jgi:hypothetical protein